jgi:hypothetical protein
MDAQGSVTNAKEDTRFLGEPGGADTSQYATDLTPSGDGGYELASARTALTYPREVYARVELTAAETDVNIIAHHVNNLSDLTFAIITDGSGNLQLRQNAAAVWTSAATVPAGDLSIAWSTRANPDTTGAGDALISEIVIYDHTAGDYWVLEQFTHAIPTTDSGWTFSAGGTWNGSAMFRPPTNPVTIARVSGSFHSHVEFAEDWIAARTPHATNFEQLVEPVGLSALLGSTKYIPRHTSERMLRVRGSSGLRDLRITRSTSPRSAGWQCRRGSGTRGFGSTSDHSSQVVTPSRSGFGSMP